MDNGAIERTEGWMQNNVLNERFCLKRTVPLRTPPRAFVFSNCGLSSRPRLLGRGLSSYLAWSLNTGSGRHRSWWADQGSDQPGGHDQLNSTFVIRGMMGGIKGNTYLEFHTLGEQDPVG
jgi:hypothetical protein